MDNKFAQRLPWLTISCFRISSNSFSLVLLIEFISAESGVLKVPIPPVRGGWSESQTRLRGEEVWFLGAVYIPFSRRDQLLAEMHRGYRLL